MTQTTDTSTLRVLKDGIFFQFEDEVKKGFFADTTAGGIFIGSALQVDAHKQARVGIVIAVGPEVDGVKKDDRILVEPLMWTEEFKYNGIRLWRTTEEKVIGILED